MKKRLRHTLAFLLLKPFFRLVITLRFGYKAKRYTAPKDVKGPFLILSNHVLAIDPFLVSLSIKGPIFYVASDMIFSIPYASKVIKFLVSPIPKTKYRSDLETVKDMKRIAQSGGSVGLFPEGNATFHGQLMPIAPSTAKLLKFLKLPVLFYNIKGAYHVKPRWASKRRKGPISGEVVKLWRYEEYQDMSLDAISEHINEMLDVNDLANTEKYLSKARAEDLESSYFVCPKCQAMNTLASKGHYFYCAACGLEAEYTEHGSIVGRSEALNVKNTKALYDFQLDVLNQRIKTLTRDEVLFEDTEEHVLSVVKATKKTSLGYGTIRLTKDAFKVIFSDYEEVWKLSNLSVAIQQKNKLIVHNSALDKTYYFINNAKRNGLKYELAIKALKNMRSDEDGV